MGDTLFIQDEGCASLAGSLQQEQPCGAEAADLCEHLLRLLLRLRRVNVPGLHCDLPVISMLHRCEPARPGVIIWRCSAIRPGGIGTSPPIKKHQANDHPG